MYTNFGIYVRIYLRYIYLICVRLSLIRIIGLLIILNIKTYINLKIS